MDRVIDKDTNVNSSRDTSYERHRKHKKEKKSSILFLLFNLSIKLRKE
jgi:hypothetical protein